MKVLPARYFGRATGRRRRPAPVWGAAVGQDIRRCEPCDAHTVHDVRRNGDASCTEDHTVVAGDPV